MRGTTFIYRSAKPKKLPASNPITGISRERLLSLRKAVPNAFLHPGSRATSTIPLRRSLSADGFSLWRRSIMYSSLSSPLQLPNTIDNYKTFVNSLFRTPSSPRSRIKRPLPASDQTACRSTVTAPSSHPPHSWPCDRACRAPSRHGNPPP